MVLRRLIGVLSGPLLLLGCLGGGYLAYPHAVARLNAISCPKLSTCLGHVAGHAFMPFLLYMAGGVVAGLLAALLLVVSLRALASLLPL